MRILVVILLIISSISVQAQREVDSLWNLWENPSVSDSVRGEALRTVTWNHFLFTKADSAYTLATILQDFAGSKNLRLLECEAMIIRGIAKYRVGESAVSLQHYQEAAEFAKSIGYEGGEARAYNSMGIFYRGTSEYDKAISSYERSIELRTKIEDMDGLASSLTNLAGIYIDIGDYPRALEVNQEGFELAVREGNLRNKCGALIVMASIYHELDQTAKALSKYQEAYATAKEIGATKRMAAALNNMGSIYMEEGDTIEARVHYEQSLVLKRESNNLLGIANTLNNLGRLYLTPDGLDEAQKYFEEALIFAQKVGDRKTISSLLCNMGTVSRMNGNHAQALIFGEQGLQAARESGAMEKIEDASISLSKTYEAVGREDDALEMYELYVTMRDSILSETNQEALVKIEREGERARELALLDKQQESRMAVFAAAKSRERLITILVTLGALLFAVFLVIVGRRLLITRRQKMKIEEQRSEIENTHLQLSEHYKEIEDSIIYAERIQRAIMPSLVEMKKILQNHFVLFEPKDIVAGDFFWMESSVDDPDLVYFAAADCTGHGVPGALISVVCSNALSKVLLEEGIGETGQLLDRTREIVIAQLAKSGGQIKDGMDISICALNIRTHQLQWSGANNPLWIVRSQVGMAVNWQAPQEAKIEEVGDYSVISLKGDRQPVGQFDHQTPFSSHSLQLLEGDSLYVFSDGYQDQFGGPKGKKFKPKKLKELLVESQSLSMDDQCKKMYEVLSDWRGDLEQVDDICLIGVKI